MLSNPAVAKGEVWFVRLPEGEGHEQFGERPSVIMADAPHFKMAVIIPATSNKDSLRFPFTYKVQSSKLNGLDSASVFLVPQLRSVSKSLLIRKMGVLEDSELKQIDSIVTRFLKLDSGNSSQPV